MHVVRHLGKLLVEHFSLQLFHLGGLPREPLRAKFVKDNAEGPNVRGLCVWLVLPQLWGQVEGRTHFLVLLLLIILILLLVDTFHLPNLL